MCPSGEHAASPADRPRRRVRAKGRARYALLTTFIAVLALVATSLVFVLWWQFRGPAARPVSLDSPRVASTGSAGNAEARLTLAIAPVVNPRDSFRDWANVAAYLSPKLGLPVDVTQRRTYHEVDDLLRSERAVVALVCSAPYVRLRKEGAVRMLAVPRVHGSVTYHSLIITRTDSPLTTFESLRGHSMAFSDPLSNSGRLYPVFRAREIGGPGSFFGSTVHTFGHDRSILSVQSGLTEAAAVDSLVYDAMVRRDPALATRTRVIERSPAFGANPVVAGRRTPPALVDKLVEVLLAMHEDPEGQAFLAALEIEAFVSGDPRLYDGIDTMLEVVEGGPGGAPGGWAGAPDGPGAARARGAAK